MPYVDIANMRREAKYQTGACVTYFRVSMKHHDTFVLSHDNTKNTMKCKFP